MYPIILEIGPIHIYSYGLMMALAFIITSLLLRKEFERREINPELAHSITLVAIVCGVIGAKAYSAIESWPWNLSGILRLSWYILVVAIGFFIFRFLFRKVFIEKIESPELTNSISFTLAVGGAVGVIGYLILANWDNLSAGFFTSMMGSGLVWYGGFIFAAIAILEIIIRSKNPILNIIDCLGPLLILGYAFGRMGCFLAGDGDYGQPSDLPWAMSFEKGVVPTPPGVHVHPTPLYEIIFCLAIFAFLWQIRKRKEHPPGFIFSAYLILAGIERFITEFWRRTPVIAFDLAKNQLQFIGRSGFDIKFKFYLGLSVAQIISLIMIAVGIWLILKVIDSRGKMNIRDKENE